MIVCAPTVPHTGTHFIQGRVLRGFEITDELLRQVPQRFINYYEEKKS